MTDEMPGAAREMTLEEYVGKLPEGHQAKKVLALLIREAADRVADCAEIRWLKAELLNVQTAYGTHVKDAIAGADKEHRARIAVEEKHDALKAELEHERLRLAACGVAATQNTAKTVADRIAKEHPCWSVSYGDVCAAVDREMSLRAERDTLKAELYLNMGHEPDTEDCNHRFTCGFCRARQTQHEVLKAELDKIHGLAKKGETK